jgi:hypothetical protein
MASVCVEPSAYATQSRPEHDVPKDSRERPVVDGTRKTPAWLRGAFEVGGVGASKEVARVELLGSREARERND